MIWHAQVAPDGQKEPARKDILNETVKEVGIDGRPILGTPRSLEAMTPGAMEAFHKRQYRGSNCCLAMAGPSSAELRSALGSSALADLLDAPEPSSPSSPLSVRPGRESVVVDRLESARLLMLWEAPRAQDQVPIVVQTCLFCST